MVNTYINSRIGKLRRIFRDFCNSRLRLFCASYIIVIFSLTSSQPLILGLIILLAVYNLRSLIVILLSVVISVISFHNFNTNFTNESIDYSDKYIEINGFILEEPKIKEYNQEVIIVAENLNGQIIANLPKYPFVYSGDKVLLKGTLSLPRNRSGNFDYVSYLKSRKIYYDFKGNVFVMETRNNITSNIKRSLRSIINRNLTQTEGSLLGGILYGDRQGYTEDFDSALRNSGLYHIVSVSGFNFSIIYISILSLRGILNRKTLLLVSAPLIIGYLILVGVDNIPAQRATIMILITILTSLIGKRSPVINLLLLTITVMLMEYPLYWTNTSFLLSFFAVAGLFAFSSKMKELLSKIDFIPDSITEILSATIAVMLTTTIISITMFESFSMISLISNILILPTIPILMFIGLIMLISGLTNIEVILKISSALLEVILKFVTESIKILGSFDSKSPEAVLAGTTFLIFIIILAIFHDYSKYKKKIA